jgi:hypothetical protein
VGLASWPTPIPLWTSPDSALSTRIFTIAPWKFDLNSRTAVTACFPSHLSHRHSVHINNSTVKTSLELLSQKKMFVTSVSLLCITGMKPNPEDLSWYSDRSSTHDRNGFASLAATRIIYHGDRPASRTKGYPHGQGSRTLKLTTGFHTLPKLCVCAYLHSPAQLLGLSHSTATNLPSPVWTDGDWDKETFEHVEQDCRQGWVQLRPQKFHDV